MIVGERTTVGGSVAIAVDGLTTGSADGDKVKPWVRFLGGSYSEGTARPVITDSEFYWERKTGKKTYVYFTYEAGDIASKPAPRGHRLSLTMGEYPTREPRGWEHRCRFSL